MRASAARACARLASGSSVMNAFSDGFSRNARSRKNCVSSRLETSLRASACESSVRLALIITRLKQGVLKSSRWPMPGRRSVLDHLRHQIEACLDLWSNTLEQLVLIALRHLVLAQARACVLR